MGCLFIWGSLSLQREWGAGRGVYKERVAQVSLCYAGVTLHCSLSQALQFTVRENTLSHEDVGVV